MRTDSAHPTPPRRGAHLIAAGIAVIVALCVGACGGGTATGPQPSLPTGHSNLQSIIEAEGLLRANPIAALTLFKSLGVDRVRTYVWWGGPDGIAPDTDSRRPPSGFDAADPADYPAANWAVYDAIVRAAAKVGIGLDVTVGSPPPLWAAGAGAPKHSVYAADWEPSANDFGQFMRAIGRRYSGHYTPPGASSPLPHVGFWSIWNEPNYGPYLAPQAIDDSTVEVAPRFYRGLVDAAWRALAATGHTPANDTILIGETAPRGLPNPANFNGMKPLRFIRALYCVNVDFKPLRGTAATERGCPATAAGSSRFVSQNPGLFDASGFADHPYPDNNSPTTRTGGKTGVDYADFAALGNLESTLDHAAAAYHQSVRLPIYSTEFGYRTDPPGTLTGVPLATAAAYLNESEYLSWREPRIRSYDQYLLTDPPSNSGSLFVTGIEFADGQPKPDVFDAFQMPLWLPVTHASASHSLVVWGCVRPAPVTARRTHLRQRVEIQWAGGAGSRYRTVGVVTLTSSGCYFETRVKFPSSGLVRLAWSGSGQTTYSRTQAISL